MSGITILTLVPNAHDKLDKCLASVTWADDIFCIVDTKTTDGSEEIARRYTEHVVVHEYVNYATQCTWALEHVQTEWTLILDADEWVSDELRDRITAIIKGANSKDGYFIRRRSYFFGKLIHHCGWERDYKTRLFRTRLGRHEQRRVHPQLIVEGSVGRIDEPMYHDTYRSFEEYFATFQRFTSWGAMDLFDKGRKPSAIDLTLRPLARFIKMYVLRLGFLDGYHGIVLCGLAAFSVFTKYAKLWNLHRVARGKPSPSS